MGLEKKRYSGLNGDTPRPPVTTPKYWSPGEEPIDNGPKYRQHAPNQSDLEDILWNWHETYGNSISQYKPGTEELQIVPELVSALTTLFNKQIVAGKIEQLQHLEIDGGTVYLASFDEWVKPSVFVAERIKELERGAE